MYRLTEEGKKYLLQGLPEKNLIKLLSKEGPLRINEIILDSKEIAIAWAKKNNWIKIENGIVMLTFEGIKAVEEEYPLEKALQEIDTKGETEEKFLKILESRKLIEKVKKLPEIEEIAQLTPEIIISGIWKSKKFKKYNVLAPAPEYFLGKKHPYVQFIEEVREKLIEMGFEEIKSPIVESEFWNCDALFMPQDHPARSVHDVFYLKKPQKAKIKDKNLLEKVRLTHENGWITGSKGWGFWDQRNALRLILRSQTTAASVRYLANFNGEQAKVFCIDRVFRPDVIDRTHLIEFDQCEGIIVGKNITFRHLLGILKEFAENVLGAKKIKFIPHYYPFTEPSVDMAVYFPKLKKWVEIVGSGMFRPEVLKPLGIKYNVAAWGFGFSRLAMLKLEIDDIRYLFSRDIKWLREYPVMKCLL
ncbi:MAG TPA: phenylalanine--tRNA ligase subunit alpha [Nanoarchaeota archaeon]|nr:phenylalanine--tRNA ligase subunit alpha [Nanoarchaeota archaeon]